MKSGRSCELNDRFKKVHLASHSSLRGSKFLKTPIVISEPNQLQLQYFFNGKQ
jgi:hypothetical protein